MSLLCHIVLYHLTRPRPVPFYPTPGVPSVWGVWRSLPPADPALSCPDTSNSRVDVCGSAGREAIASPCASGGAGGTGSHLRRRSHVAGEGVDRFGNDVTDVTPSRRATAALRLPPPVPCWRRGPQRGGSGGSGSPSGSRPDGVQRRPRAALPGAEPPGSFATGIGDHRAQPESQPGTGGRAPYVPGTGGAPGPCPPLREGLRRCWAGGRSPGHRIVPRRDYPVLRAGWGRRRERPGLEMPLALLSLLRASGFARLGLELSRTHCSCQRV